MRIAFLTTEYVTDEFFDGGLASYLGRVTTALVERGHQVEVFVTTQQNRGEVEYHGVLVHRIYLQGGNLWHYVYRFLFFVNRGLIRLRLPHFLHTLNSLYCAYRLSRALQSRMRCVDFDIIQASNYQGSAYFAAGWCRRPIVVRASSYAPYWSRAYRMEKTLDARLAGRFEMAAFKRCRWHYAPSRQIAEAYRRHEDIQVDVLKPPFHLSNVKADTSVLDTLPGGKPYLLHFGKIGRMKGSGVLAEALQSLLEAGHELSACIAGRVLDAEGQRLVDLQLRYPKQVSYLGLLSPAQLYPVIENAHLVVLPSLVDNLPNTALEAMYFRRVVIGTRGASFEELIEDGISGFLVQPGDAVGLSKAIRTAWRLDLEDAAQIGARAEARIHEMHPEIVIPGLEQYFQAILESYQEKQVMWR